MSALGLCFTTPKRLYSMGQRLVAHKRVQMRAVIHWPACSKLLVPKPTYSNGMSSFTYGASCRAGYWPRTLLWPMHLFTAPEFAHKAYKFTFARS